MNRLTPRIMSRVGSCFLSLVFLVSCSPETEHTYFPLDGGRWHYAITITPGYEVKETMRSIRESLPLTDVTRIEGASETSAGVPVLYENVLPIRHENDTLYYYRANSQGIERLAFQSSGGSALRWEDNVRPVLRYPLQKGQSWKTSSQTYLLVRRLPLDMGLRATEPFYMHYTIEDTQAVVSVPAGTYANCLKVRGQGKASFIGYRGTGSIDVTIEHIDHYAPHVGLIKSQRTETSSSQLFGTNYYLMELSAYEP
ncbi:MAG: hypothetical protein GDA50_04435 [Alphaproteobacteria bacterium GM202ARS2]|nr:hypothetical protein [Alphaproteobacteria bacterium GM202ARS2]